MHCDGFPTEDYDAYALGTLESDLDLEIRAHVNDSCDTCLPRVKQSLRLWAIFGPAIAPEVVRSRDKGRVRVVPLIPGKSQDGVGSEPAVSAGRQSNTWRNLALAASLAFVAGAASWFLGSQLGRDQGHREVATLKSQLDSANQDAEGLRRQIASTREAAESLRAREKQVTDLQALLSQREQQIQVLLKTRTDLTNSLQIAQTRAAEGSRILDALSLPNTRLIPVPGTDVAPGATGYALLAENNRVVFHVNNLPPLAPGRVYQLWLIRGQAPQVVSGGIFTLSANRSAEIEFTQGALIQSVQALAVTDEPAGGSPGPTGQKFLVGAVKS